MAELEVAVVAVDGMVWEGQAKSVVVKTVEGDIGLLPGHEPVLAILADAPVRVIQEDGKTRVFAVHGGFFSMDSNKVSILAESAESAKHIDLESAKLAKADAEAGDLEDPKNRAALRTAETKIRVATGE